MKFVTVTDEAGTVFRNLPVPDDAVAIIVNGTRITLPAPDGLEPEGALVAVDRGSWPPAKFLDDEKDW